MASAIATATMAAAGFDKRPSNRPASLKTPASGTFPSEMLSPIPAGSPGLRKDDSLKTPITPPSAYLDFLRNCTPAMMSPASPNTSTPRFNFAEKRSFDRISDETKQQPSASPASNTTLSRNSSYDSTSTSTTSATEQSTTTTTSSRKSFSAACRRPGIDSPTLIIPPSPFAKPNPRLRIPQSPYSAQSMPSPYSNTPLSAAPWSATTSFSPRDPDSTPQPRVSVRHVVTRTVTYCRTALDPAPRGKRRRVEEADSDVPSSRPASSCSHSRSSSTISSSSGASDQPVIKQEKPEPRKSSISSEVAPVEAVATSTATATATPSVS